MTKFNKFLVLLFSFITIILFIYYKEISILLFLIYLWLPFIFKLKDSYTLIYLIFGFLAILLGFLLHLYKITTWYDSLVHFIWGIVSSLIAIVFLKKFRMYDEKKLSFNIMFIIIFTLGISCFWEISEFIIDTIFKSDMQRRTTGVYDTMKDVIVALLGNILFVIWYFYEYKYDKKILIRNYIVRL